LDEFFFSTVGGIITGLIFAKEILLYEQLGLPFSSDMSGVWKAENGQDEKVLEAGRILNEEIPHKVFSVDYTLYEINKAFGPILLAYYCRINSRCCCAHRSVESI
jgi:hypothetical protein